MVKFVKSESNDADILIKNTADQNFMKHTKIVAAKLPKGSNIKFEM